MTHWIIDNMVYRVSRRMAGRSRSNDHVYSGGRRVSCDGGKSWIVAGTIRFGLQDSFSSDMRELTLEEYHFRCHQMAGRSITFEGPGSGNANQRGY